MPSDGSRLTTLVLASTNRGKVREIGILFAGCGFPIIVESITKWTESFDPPETGTTFAENALIKAKAALGLCKQPVIADDSGISVDALDGGPGVFSARFAGPGAIDSTNNEKLLAALDGLKPEQRGAAFVCHLTVLLLGGQQFDVEASWRGVIAEKPRGYNGFGYDPLFWLPERNCTSAQLPPEEKNRISHRGQAVQAMVAELRKAGLLDKPRS